MRAKKTQKTTWIEQGHVDLRHLASGQKLPAEDVVETHDDTMLALAVLEWHLDFTASEIIERTVVTPVGDVRIERSKLFHIVEKRQDARERYVKYALATMKDPLEVWLVAYEDNDRNEEYRHAYIGAFEGKQQMLVVFAESNGRILWNFMHCDSKSLNKHRHGECLYRRP